MVANKYCPNKERLTDAIAFMSKVDNRKLNMTTFQEGYDEYAYQDYDELMHTCGTTACFAGHMVFNPMYQSWHGGPTMYDIVDEEGCPNTPPWFINSPGAPKGYTSQQLRRTETIFAEYFHIPAKWADALIFNSSEVFNKSSDDVNIGDVIAFLTCIRDYPEQLGEWLDADMPQPFNSFYSKLVLLPQLGDNNNG